MKQQFVNVRSIILDQYLPSVWSGFKCPNFQLQVKDHILEARTLMWSTHALLKIYPGLCLCHPRLQSTSENPDGICSLSVSEFLSLMNQFATTTEQIKGWKYESIMEVLKHLPLPIIFFSQIQNKIPIDLIMMSLYYKSCHPRLPWAGQQQNNIGRGHSSLWKAHTRTSK